MTTPRTALLALTAMLELGATACTGFAPAADEAMFCASDAECGAPFVCVFGACYDPGDAALHSVSLEVVPASSSGRPTQQFPGFVVSGQSRSEVRLSATVHAYLRVQDAAGLALQALVTAELGGAIPGRALRVDERTASDGVATLGLISGQAYALRVQPDDASAVPFRPGTLFANSDVDGPQHVQTVQSPGASELLRVRGRAVVSTSTPTGIRDLRVQLRALVGTPPERRVVSSSAITSSGDVRPGAFELLLPRDLTSGLQLHLAPTASNPYFPVVTVDGLDLDADTDLGDVAIGEVGVPLEVSGQLRGPAGAVAGASLRFVGAVGRGQFEASAVTGSDGRYSINLLPGLYQVVAVPPVSSPAGLSELAEPVLLDSLAPGTQQLDLTALPRGRMSGSVRDHDGVPVRGATLRASRLGNAPEAAAGLAAQVRTVFESRSDIQGRYELPLDPGLYELAVIPPSDALLPRRSDLLVAGLSDVERDFALFAAAPFGGQVTAEDAPEGLPGSLVRAFLVLADDRVMQAGEALADQSGAFSIVLPSFGNATAE